MYIKKGLIKEKKFIIIESYIKKFKVEQVVPRHKLFQYARSTGDVYQRKDDEILILKSGTLKKLVKAKEVHNIKGESK
jgi:hypothetical protein